MTEEYDLHLSRPVRDRVVLGQYDSFTAEDVEELDRIIREETGSVRRRQPKKKRNR